MNKIKEFFGHHLENIEDNRCCKLCKHSYLREHSDHGYCKLQDNAFSSMHPKIITELHTCDKWEKKPKND